MNAYFVDYPRDFANEYTVYACWQDEAKRFAEAFPNMKRIDRREAIRLGWIRPREAKRAGEQWYGGFAWGQYEPDTLEESIIGAREAGEAKLDLAEALLSD